MATTSERSVGHRGPRLAAERISGPTKREGVMIVRSFSRAIGRHSEILIAAAVSWSVAATLVASSALGQMQGTRLDSEGALRQVMSRLPNVSMGEKAGAEGGSGWQLASCVTAHGIHRAAT